MRYAVRWEMASPWAAKPLSHQLRPSLLETFYLSMLLQVCCVPLGIPKLFLDLSSYGFGYMYIDGQACYPLHEPTPP